MNFLTSILETSVEESLPLFDGSSIDDVLTFIAFVEEEDDVRGFKGNDIDFRVRVETDPDAIDHGLDSDPESLWPELIRWGVGWEHDSLFDQDARTQRYVAYLTDESADGDLGFAVQHPTRFVRQALANSVDAEWIFKPAALAELLSCWGPNSLLPALGKVIGTSGFDVLVPFVVANGWFERQCEVETGALQQIASDPTKVAPFQVDFAVCFALADEEPEQLALVQATAVLELERRLESHPAIDGCPGTGSDVAENELETFERERDDSGEWQARKAIVDAALERKHERELTSLATPNVSRSIANLSAMMSTIDHPDANADLWLQWFKTCDPTFGGFCRDAIALWLVRDL